MIWRRKKPTLTFENQEKNMSDLIRKDMVTIRKESRVGGEGRGGGKGRQVEAGDR